MAGPVSSDFGERLGEVFTRAAGRLAPEVGRQLMALVSPGAIAIVSATLLAWIVGHLFGVGEVIDVVIGVVGFFSIGMAVFTGLDELLTFGRLAYGAKTDADLDAAADALTQAVTTLGIQTVLAVLLKSAPKTGRMPVAEEPPPGPGWRYKPSTTINRDLDRETGNTSFWGDVEVAAYGDKTELAVTALHEKVHQFLTPKVYVLRRFRVENRRGSIFGSSIVRYFEEMLAETISQVGIRGWSQFWVGIRFPVRNGYVALFRPGGYNTRFGGKGLLPEGASLLGKGVAMGQAFEIWFKSGVPMADEAGFMARHADLMDAALRAIP